MKKLLTMIGAAAAAAGANATTNIIYGPDASGLVWTNQLISGTNVKLVSTSGNNQASGSGNVSVSFDAAQIPWTFTVDDTTYTVTSFDSNVFKNWAKITGSFSIPDEVTGGIGTLEACYGITNLSIGSGITTIGNYKLKNMDGLTSLVVPATVTSVGQQLVYGADNLKGLWIKGPTTVASGTQTYTEIYGIATIARCYKLRTVLFGPNTKWTAGSSAINDGNTLSTKLYVPGNGYWDDLSTSGAGVTILKYGAGQELDIAIDESTMTLTATPTTENALTNVLASAAYFKECFGLDTVVSITNDISASVEITEELLNDVTLNVPTWYMTFAVKTQAQLDRVLAATTGPIVTDITGATEEITPPVGRRVAILAPGGVVFNYKMRGFIISFR